MAVQINGKVRAKIVVSKDVTKDELEKLALEDEHVKELLEGKEVKKVIAIPGRLINIVAARLNKENPRKRYVLFRGFFSCPVSDEL